MENEPEHAVLSCRTDQLSWVDTVSAEYVADLGCEMVDDLVDVELFPQGLVFPQEAVDELSNRNGSIEVEVLLEEKERLLVALPTVLSFIILKEPPPDD